jgi:hypothetical protein
MDLCGVVKSLSLCWWHHSFCEIQSPHHSLLLWSHIPCVRGWCVSNFIKLSCCRKTNLVGFDYKLCVSSICCTGRIKVLVVLIDSILYFHHRTDYMFSQSGKLLGLIPTVNVFFPSVRGLLMILHICVILDLLREVVENCALLRYYAEYSGNSLPTFRDNLSAPALRVEKSDKKARMRPAEVLTPLSSSFVQLQYS